MGKRKSKNTKEELKEVMETTRNWRMGDYIRQLSVVVVGIVVTFWGSDAIKDYQQQREIRSVMRLIKKELEENHKEVRRAGKKWKEDCTISLLLEKNDFQYQKIPRDTLLKYKGVIGSYSSISPATDALDVLKGSGLLQSVSDKDFVFKLTQTYQALRDVATLLENLNENKMKAWDTIEAKGLSPEDEKKYAFGDFVEIYRIYLGFYQMRSAIRNLPYYFNSDIFSEIDKAIDETIQAIEQKYE